jgi:hypothetical protein
MPLFRRGPNKLTMPDHVYYKRSPVPVQGEMGYGAVHSALIGQRVECKWLGACGYRKRLLISLMRAPPNQQPGSQSCDAKGILSTSNVGGSGST